MIDNPLCFFLRKHKWYYLPGAFVPLKFCTRCGKVKDYSID